MKTVYFIRHAKSSWSDSSLDDFDRPLNERGERDAPFMAEKLKEMGIRPDAIISSPANRALTTAQQFAETLGIAVEDIIEEEDIYEAYSDTVVQIVQEQPDSFHTILVFGHNPAFTTVANSFEGDYIDNVPTCGIVKIAAAVKKWEQFGFDKGRVLEFYYPKQYLD